MHPCTLCHLPVCSYKPQSIDSYLSRIANQLETHFPKVHMSRKCMLVARALQGTKRCFSIPTHWKLPLTRADLLHVPASYGPTPSHNDLLFTTQLFTGTDCLMRLAELTWANTLALWDYHKVSMQPSVKQLPEAFSFWLPGHKADQFYEGNQLYIRKSSTVTYRLFGSYLSSHDQLFHGQPELWLCHNGTIPTWTWFITCLRKFFPIQLLVSLCVQVEQLH